VGLVNILRGLESAAGHIPVPTLAVTGKSENTQDETKGNTE